VQAGYRVIDEYVKQGQSAARAMWEPSGGGLGGDDLQRRFLAVMRTATDFASLWMDFLGGGVGRGPWGTPTNAGRTAPPGSVEIHPFSIGEAKVANGESRPHTNGDARPHAHADAWHAPAPAANDATRAPETASFVVDVASARRTETILDLRPGSARTFRVHDLRAVDPEAPRLAGATVERVHDGERVRVRLSVPADHPPGVYSALVLDEATALPKGSLTVRVFADGEP
jgi:hypothetical protein